ncbi:MAG: CPBP family intramembrane metalloprotease [Flavobacteriales bacterium]|nr:CPBP family intramembrane metalloprotease [Flavobacteriales bacterium]
MKRRNFILLALVTLVGFSGGGLLVIYYFNDTPMVRILTGGFSFPMQVFIGIIYGIITGWTAKTIVESDFLQPVRAHYAKLMSPLELSNFDIILISLCAGIGEELFFRAGIQPLLGLWPTSILFVALHGYLNPMNLRLSLYGMAMTVIIAGMGVLFLQTGIVTAIVAHAVIDVILLKMIDTMPEDVPAEDRDNY